MNYRQFRKLGGEMWTISSTQINARPSGWHRRSCLWRPTWWASGWLSKAHRGFNRKALLPSLSFFHRRWWQQLRRRQWRCCDRARSLRRPQGAKEVISGNFAVVVLVEAAAVGRTTHLQEWFHLDPLSNESDLSGWNRWSGHLGWQFNRIGPIFGPELGHFLGQLWGHFSGCYWIKVAQKWPEKSDFGRL